jgi:glycosyltransferase involved in cell wall biosynthesis
MNAFGQTVCLNMIVKNESAVIRRCLDSVRRIVDHWIIVDTGSSDGTQEVIREHFHDVPGELMERPWVNFAHNRSEALVYARGKADYVLVIDADEVLDYDKGFALPRLTADAYHFEIQSGGISYFKTQLVRDSLEWSFKSVLHEYICSEHQATEETMAGVRTLRFPDGARARDPLTYRKDALVLETALLEEPDNDRYMFYLAQSYRDANEPELAIDRYQKRVKMGRWIEEVWYSLYQIAEIKNRMKAPWPEALDAYLKAFQTKPDRAGPLYKIGYHYQAQRDFAVAHLFLKQAMSIPYPVNDRLFVEKTIYDYLLPLEYAVACYYTGDHTAAIDTNNRLLAGRDTPASLIEQVVRNRQFSLDALYPKRGTNGAGRNKIKVCVTFKDAGPHLDNCVESLLQQDHADFQAIFIDNASTGDHSGKIPLEDPRFHLVRHESRQDWSACLGTVVAGQCSPDDVVLTLDGVHWLPEPDTLSYVDRFFNEYGCALMYGQYRYSNGQPGLAMPLRSAADLDAGPQPELSIAPVAFRASLFSEKPPGNGDTAFALLKQAGWGRARFNDHPVLVWNLEV